MTVAAVLRRLADDAPVDIDTEDFLRKTADRLEECEKDARAVLDALAAAERKLREEECDQLRAALERFGEHHGTCESVAPVPGVRCTCGLHAALAALNHSQPADHEPRKGPSDA